MQVGKRFQQPAGSTSSPAQYERAHYMLDRLGLTVRDLFALETNSQ